MLLGLLRDAGCSAQGGRPLGQFQQSLPQGRVYQLLRLRLPDGHDFVPEISGHRLMVSIRLMRQGTPRAGSSRPPRTPASS